MSHITFLGAAGTVTGSKHLLEWEGTPRHRILLDCGLFQGLKELRVKNWEPLPVAPEVIDAVIISHAHIDHLGYLPRLVRDGFDGPIYGAAATCDMAEIMLRDSAHLQEEDTRLARKFGFSKHKDPQPLYTLEDAERVFPLLRPLPYYKPYPILNDATVTLRHSGHVLGAAFVEIVIIEHYHSTKIVYTGDIGRYNQPLLLDPDPPTSADYLIMECTYGDRLHQPSDPKRELSEVINRTVERGGSVVIPAFALGRSQQILQYIAELIDEGKIPKLDVFLDSPMAVAATRQTRAHLEELDVSTLARIRLNALFNRSEYHYLTTREQSQKLNNRDNPCIIVSASGMAVAGRVLHHLARRLPAEKNTVIFVGYQVEGSRGRRLIEGEKEIKIHGNMIPVKAEIVNLSAMSGHADYSEIMSWLEKMKPPTHTFLVHGEISGLQATAERLQNKLGWKVTIPALGETIELAPVAKPVPVAEAIPSAVPSLAPAITPLLPTLPPGAVAVVLGSLDWDSVLTKLPGTVVFREEPSEELANRLLRSNLFHEVIILSPSHTKNGVISAFREILKKGGIQTWTLVSSVK